MNILERIKTLEREVKSLRITDSEDILAERGPLGTQLHLEDPAAEEAEETGDAYNGYFKVIRTAADKIKIVDGMDEDSEYCGKVAVNKLALAAVAAREFTISADAYIYLRCIGLYDDDGNLTSSSNSIVKYTTEQSWEAEREKILISRVKFADGAITGFSREPVSGRIFIIGACD
ncbi:MAG: hypothetical protein PHV82_13660 [Victivallaceae bacterium]|nr:hypothetical protein [Victivallaceae bacterium]